jgi:hypothetical protein
MLLGEDGDIRCQFLSVFGGDEVSDSSHVELLRLQPMLPKSLGTQRI